MSSKGRLQILKKIAQTTGAPATISNSPTSTATPTSNNVQVPPDPSPPASSLYSSLRIGFDPARITIIDSLVRILSSATNVATNGQYNFQNLKNSNFQFDPSGFPSTDRKNLLVFFRKVFRTLLNNGENYTQAVTANDLRRMIPYLLQSPELANMSQISPTGQIAQKAPPGNFKDNIRELVSRLAPTTPTRRA